MNDGNQVTYKTSLKILFWHGPFKLVHLWICSGSKPNVGFILVLILPASAHLGLIQNKFWRIVLLQTFQVYLCICPGSKLCGLHFGAHIPCYESLCVRVAVSVLLIKAATTGAVVLFYCMKRSGLLSCLCLFSGSVVRKWHLYLCQGELCPKGDKCIIREYRRHRKHTVWYFCYIHLGAYWILHRYYPPVSWKEWRGKWASHSTECCLILSVFFSRRSKMWNPICLHQQTCVALFAIFVVAIGKTNLDFSTPWSCLQMLEISSSIVCHFFVLVVLPVQYYCTSMWDFLSAQNGHSWLFGWKCWVLSFAVFHICLARFSQMCFQQVFPLHDEF